MMTLFINWFIKNKEDTSKPSVKKAYATLSSAVGIILNLFLCTSKIAIGIISNSIAISADGFNNLSDAGTSLVSLLGFKIAQYDGGSVHKFGHGRIEWIMGIFTSIAVLLMGVKLVGSSINAIGNPQKPLFSISAFIVLVLSILVKAYMYYYNRKFAKLTDSETLKATATDCISDTIATTAVMLSVIVSQMTNWLIDGYCGVLVSAFIIFAGTKSLWEVLGRIMGKSTDQFIVDDVLQMTKSYTEIIAVHNLMLHDYGFGYFVVSMHIEGMKTDYTQLYNAVNQISYVLYKKYHCDSSIQIDYLIHNETLSQTLTEQIYLILRKYSMDIEIDNFRLVENGSFTNIVFEMIYPAELQKNEDDICSEVTRMIEFENSKCKIYIKGIIRRERFSLHR